MPIKLGGIARQFLAMKTANPAAGAALAFQKLGQRPVDMIFSSLGFLSGDSPANPLIAG